MVMIGIMLLTATSGFAQSSSGRPGDILPPKKPNVAPGSKPAPRANRTGKAAAPATITLTILAEPDTAVFIDGNRRGLTNAEGRLQLPKFATGQYTVEVRKEGYVADSKVFTAGTDSPTLIFKLEPDLQETVRRFDSLIGSGTVTATGSPNAYDVYAQLARKYPNRPEVARMRGVLATKLTEAASPVINQTVLEWRKVSRDELVRAEDAARKAAELKREDRRAQAEAAYLRAVLSLRDWQTGEAAEGLASARSELEKVTAAEASYAPALYQLGIVQLYANDASAAEFAFQKAAQLEPRWVVAHIGVGCAQIEGKKYREAMETFRKALALNANNAAAIAGLGYARALKGETREGIKDLERAKQVDPTSGLPYLYLGTYYSQSRNSKERQQATLELQSAIAKNPENLEFQNRHAEQLLGPTAVTSSSARSSKPATTPPVTPASSRSRASANTGSSNPSRPPATTSASSKTPAATAKKNKAAALPPGTPILWAARPAMSQLDLFWGIGGQEHAPRPPFTFDKEDLTGTNPKIKVLDANGAKWNVKFDEEVQAEVAASRIVWACGFMVEESYFVPAGKVNGVTGLTRAKKFVAADGSFLRAMFEKRPDTIVRRNVRWAWDSNPFVGSKEFSGLAILNTMLNNWDAKVDNNNVLGMVGDDTTTIQDWYIQSDWGGTFGKMGGVFSHTKWSVPDFAKQAFITGVSGGRINLNYSGKMGSSLKSVPVDHARWFAGIVGQLSDKQLTDAFRAAGATDAEMSGFVGRLRQKIEELKAAVGR